MITVTELQAINKKVAEAKAQKEKEYIEAEVLPAIESHILKANAKGQSMTYWNPLAFTLSIAGRRLVVQTLSNAGYEVNKSSYSPDYYINWKR